MTKKIDRLVRPGSMKAARRVADKVILIDKLGMTRAEVSRIQRAFETLHPRDLLAPSSTPIAFEGIDTPLKISDAIRKRISRFHVGSQIIPSIGHKASCEIERGKHDA